MHYNMSNNTNNMTDTSMTDPRGWAVQPAAWANFDPDGAVYCLDIHTAYRVARDQKAREGDQMIWRMTSGKPIKWVRVTDDEVAQSAYQGA